MSKQLDGFLADRLSSMIERHGSRMGPEANDLMRHLQDYAMNPSAPGRAGRAVTLDGPEQS